MNQLITGVNAGIGAARTHKFYIVIGDFAGGFCQLFLHSANTGFLLLPAVEFTAIVFEDQCHTAVANECIRCKRLGFKKQKSARCVVWVLKDKAGGQKALNTGFV